MIGKFAIVAVAVALCVVAPFVGIPLVILLFFLGSPKNNVPWE